MADSSRNIILAVTGGIAAYKAADLASKLVQAGASVRVAFSHSAHQFISPLVFEALTGHPVYRHVFDTPESYQMEHITWARWAHALVVAPASADTIARMAHGLADCPVTTLYLAFRGPTFIAPSMNTAMLEHTATQANLSTLSDRNVHIVTSGIGNLACGETGSGRMAEPTDIMAALGFPEAQQTAGTNLAFGAVSPTPPMRPPDDTLSNTTVLITSGPTREYIDPVRFISNPSSGKMGYALAREAMRRGAHVHFITGPVESRFLPSGDVNIHRVETARDMHLKVQELKSQCHLFLFAAAVGDFRPANSINQKIKRTGNSITLPLVENPDIAQSVGFTKEPGQITIGFAAETNDHDLHGQAKLQRKHLDAVVINDVSNSAIGFGSDDNEVQILTTHGEAHTIPRTSKENVAYEILQVATELLESDAADSPVEK